MEAYRFDMKYSEAIGRVSINQSKYTLYFIYIYHQNDLVNNMLCRTHLLPYILMWLFYDTAKPVWIDSITCLLWPADIQIGCVMIIDFRTYIRVIDRLVESEIHV